MKDKHEEENECDEYAHMVDDPGKIADRVLLRALLLPWHHPAAERIENPSDSSVFIWSMDRTFPERDGSQQGKEKSDQ